MLAMESSNNGCIPAEDLQSRMDIDDLANLFENLCTAPIDAQAESTISYKKCLLSTHPLARISPDPSSSRQASTPDSFSSRQASMSPTSPIQQPTETLPENIGILPGATEVMLPDDDELFEETEVLEAINAPNAALPEQIEDLPEASTSFTSILIDAMEAVLPEETVTLTEAIDEPSQPETSKTATTLYPAIAVGITTRKEFRVHVEKILDQIQEKGQRILKDIVSLDNINLASTEIIDSLKVDFKVAELGDGGIMIKVYVNPEIVNEKINLNSSSSVYLEKMDAQNASIDVPNTNMDVQNARMAMKDAIRFLPNFVYGQAIEPVSEYSFKYLAKRLIFKNEKATKRYDSSLFCRLCESHVRNANLVLHHIRQSDHSLLNKRFYNRCALSKHWKQYAPTSHPALVRHLIQVQSVAEQQMQSFYRKASRKDVKDTLIQLTNCVKGYTFEFHLFGSYQSGMITTMNPMIDCFIKIKRSDGSEPTFAEKIQAFRKLPFEIPDRAEIYPFNGYICKVKYQYLNEEFFFTFDPKAWNAVLSTQLVSLYMFVVPPIRMLAMVFRQWVMSAGFLKPNSEYRISGAIFDYMVISHFQKYYEIPVIDEEKMGCSIEEFLQKDIKEQLRLVKQYFDKFLAQFNCPSLEILFTNLFLYYGCGFDYKNCVQITSTAQVTKDNNGVKTVKIMDPISPTSNIFLMRPEHALHLDNLIFYTCCELLQPYDQRGYFTGYFESIAVEYISGNGDFGFPYLVFNDTTGKNSVAKNSGLGSMFKNGLVTWYQNKIPRVDLKCQFCKRTRHTERTCNYLKLDYLKGRSVAVELFSVFSMAIMQYYEQENITEDYLLNAKTFIADIESRVYKATGIQIKLQPFGSLESGFGSKTSDFDLCVKLADGRSINEKNGVELLISIGDVLMAEAGFEIVHVFAAKVPILKFNCTRHNQLGDISFSNQLALRNTQLLAAYAAFDKRVAPLGIALKKWAKDSEINNSANHTLSSYALIIMLIHFLQRVEPPVLPYLQDKEEFGLQEELIDEHEVQFAVPSAEYINAFSRNTMSLGELFTRFFDYFGIFNWHDNVVQIRSRSVDHPLKMDKGWNQSVMAIEDPFDLGHNLSSNVRLSHGLLIFKCINFMQAECGTCNGIFSNGDFNFNSDLFKTFISNLTSNSYKGIVCFYCKKIGHFKGECPEKEKYGIPHRKPPPSKRYDNRPRNSFDNTAARKY